MSSTFLSQSFPSLVDLLRGRAALQPDSRVFTFLAKGPGDTESLTYGELDRRSRLIAAELQRLGLQGERGLLLFGAGLDFISAFLGCLYAGVVAVPTYPPGTNRPQQRLRTIVSDSRPRVVLTTSDTLDKAREIARFVPELEAVSWIAVDRLADGLAGEWRHPGAVASTLAFLQYTSGSTADPKGVMVSHGNLLHNEEMIRRAFRQSESSVVVGWLPLYHDMGLIGNVLQTVYAGAQCVLMSPLAFLSRPMLWLQAISRFGGTTSGGPNFAYDLCARRATPEDLAALDLRSWEVAFNGAEPIRAATLERFAEVFAPCGFRREAFYPCYGLAEATLFVTGGAVGREPRVTAFAAEELERNQVVEAPEDTGRELVSCGTGWMDQEIAVVDPDTRSRCGAGRVGEIWIAGPSVAHGYWSSPETSERDFRARLADDPAAGPFLRTGDLGFLHGGELYVTGRLKDLIIVRGRNHYPQDLELTAEGAHPALRRGCSASFGVEVDGEERVVVVAEVEKHADGTDVGEISGMVRQALAAEHEIGLHDFVLLRSGSLPKTSSGKIRRRACRDGYLNGGLDEVGRSGAPEVPAVDSGAVLDRGALLALDPPERLPALLAYLCREAARAARLPVSQVAPEEPLIRLGLDSLAAIELQGAVEMALGVAVPVSGLLEGMSAAALAEELMAGLGSGSVRDLLVRSELPELGERPVSVGQQSIWLVDRLSAGSGVFNLAGAAEVRSGLDVDRLRAALERLVERHPVLRSTFTARGGELRREVHARLGPALLVQDEESETETWLAREAWRSFDLESEPPLRVSVLRRGGSSLLLLVVHHIAADLWSIAVMLRDLGRLYERLYADEELPRPAAGYDDFVAAQERELAGPAGERAWAYWHGQLAGELPLLALPADRPHPLARSYRAGAVELRLEPMAAEIAEAVRRQARDQGSSLFTALLSAFAALLHRYTGQADLLIGAPAAGRLRPELQDVVGYCVNPVVLRADLSGAPGFPALLPRLRERVVGALEHQTFPFALLVERLQQERDPSRSPLFQAAFALQRADLPELSAFALGRSGDRLDLGGLVLESRTLPDPRLEFDLMLVAAETADGLGFSLRYSADLFDHGTIERMAGHLALLLEGLASGTARSVAELPLLSAAEHAQILVDWNRTERPRTAEPLHRRFESQARRTPDALAVAADGESLTYRELNERANRLARHLERMGVGMGSRVGLCLERSLDLMVGLWGVLKAGAAYVPIDVEYPRERVAFMLADAGVKAVLSKEPLSGLNVPVIRLDADWEQIAKQSGADPESAADPDSLLYVIYTSGSTGRPKGAGVYQRAFLNLVDWFIEEFDLSDQDRSLVISSFSFDLTQKNLYATLLLGGELHLNPPGYYDAVEIADRIERRGITLVNCTPSAFYPVADALLDRGWGSSLRRVFLGGEPISVERLGAWNLAEVINTYGPTECTDIAAFYRLSPETRTDRPVPVGHPIANARVYVLDRHLQPCPVGVVGELCVGGLGVGLGYLNDAGLTASKFVPNEFGEPGARLYRTGDVARWLPDGELEFLGRADEQVKVRGFRIEPGEIEAVLRQHPAVEEAAVLLRQGQLVAYVVPDREKARPVATLARLGELDGVQSYELPNGMTIFHQNQAETEFLYHELFEEESYLRYGVKMWDGACVFNVGANIGLFDLYLSQRWKDLRILAFEPLPPIARVLRLNLDLYGAPVEVFEHGLASEPGQAVFDFYTHVSILSGRFADLEEERETVRKYLLAQLPEGEEIDEAVLEELIEERLERQSFECSMRTLSEVIAETGVERIDLLKVDVEKAELDVLSGLAESDWPKVYQVVAEVHDVDGRLEQITDLLRRHGFEVEIEQEEELRENEIFNLFAWRPEVATLASPKREPEPVWASRDRLRADLRDSVCGRLPEYMVPSAFVLLDALPLTPNGKLDRRSLLSMAVESAQHQPMRPLSAVEEMVSGLWADVLGIEPPKDPEASFFSLGGHSLLATQLVSRIRDVFGTELAVRRLFESPTLAGLARAIEEEGSGSAIPELARRSETGPAPLSFAQERLWFLHQLHPEDVSYNMPAAVQILGLLDVPALSAAIAEVVRRHEVLRSVFAAESGGSVQVVEPARPIPLPWVDLGGLDPDRRESEARRLAREEARRPFDLRRGPLLRLRLLRLGSGEHRLLFVMHHIVSDGWSVGVLVRELTELYGAFVEGRPSPLPELPLQYADFAVWQRDWFQGEARERQLSYWRNRLRGLPPELNLPYDRVRTSVDTVGRGAEVALDLPPSLRDAAQAWSRRRGATLFITLLSALEALLHRYTGERDLAVGTPVANRNRSQSEGLIGFFVNMLVLRGDLSGDPGFAGLVSRVRRSALEAYEHQDTPFEAVVEELNPERRLGRTPLFQVAFAFQNTPRSELRLPGVSVELERVLSETAIFNLSLFIEEREEGLRLDLQYAADLLDESTVLRLGRHFGVLLEQALADPERRISELALLDEHERRQMLVDWNRTETPRTAEPLHRRFEAQARRTPDALAVAMDGESLTYRDLNERSNRLARHLKRLGVGLGSRVGLCLERSLDLMVSLWGVLKAGAAYVPIDVEYPRERVAFMLADAGVKAVLSKERWVEPLGGLDVPVVRLDADWEQIAKQNGADPESASDPDSLLYVIYTSGSTGRPKGAGVYQRAFLNLVDWFIEEFDLSDQDRSLVISSFSFDLTQKNLYATLLLGGELHLNPPGYFDAVEIAERIERRGITLINCTPSAFYPVADVLIDRGVRSLRRVFLGGEPISLERLGAWNLAEVINTYGPTECTDIAAFYRLSPETPADRPVPVGHPIANARVYVLDRHLQPCPVGVVGELCVGGLGVGMGYLNDAGLTASKFVPNEFGEPGARLYRTGDVARWLADGELEFLGRADEQVKVRGFRIEPGEIEAALRQHPAVEEAAVLLRQGQLVAYVVPDRERARPVATLARLGDLERAQRYELPNGMTIFHHNQAETEFLYHELFEEESYLRHGVKMWDGACVFNVGANIGLFDLYLTQRWRDLRILAFEPLPPISRVLRLNLDLYGAPVEVFEHGLASAPGRAVFDFYPHVSILSGRFADLEEERETVRKYLLAQLPEGGEIDEAVLEELIEERLERQSYECSMRTLSEVIAETGVERIDLLKVDVEKAELDVLSGLSESDWPKVYQVVAEVHDVDGRLEQITSLLRRHGFEVAVEQEEELRENEIFNLFAWRPEVVELASLKREPEPVWASRDRLRADLQESLGSRLPEYMVPSAFVILDALPLTPNGKLDRRSLLLLSVESTERRAARPLSAMEEMVSGLWADVLGIDPPKDPEASFFSLGGHSLLATQLVSRIRDAFGTELAVRRLFEAPTLAGLARAIEVEGSGSAIPELVRRTGTGPAPLSFAQERLWFLHQLHPEDVSYNMQAAVQIRGLLDVPALSAAIGEVVRRHEVLRSVFAAESGGSVQVVEPWKPVPLPWVDLGGLDPESREDEARRLARDEARRPFDLRRGPLLRLRLLRLGSGEHRLLFVMHHIVSDGWSIGVLVRELTELYNAFVSDRPSPLPELPLQYADFAVWQRDWFQGEARERQLSYWRNRLRGLPPELSLPYDRARASMDTVGRGAEVSLELPPSVRDAAQAWSRRRGATLFITLLSALEALLHRYTGERDFAVGTPVANRNRLQSEGLIGFFVNMLVLRGDLSGDPGFAGLVSRVRRSALEAYEHQDTPFEAVVEELNPERRLGRTPLFQVAFAFQNTPRSELRLPGVSVELERVLSETAIFNLSLFIEEREEGLRLDLQYAADLFDAATVLRLGNHFGVLLEQALADPERRISELALLDGRERDQILVDWNRTETARTAEPLHRRFEAQAQRTPDALAVAMDGESLTYRDLNEQSNRLARHLRRLGVGLGSRVGLCLERSLDLMVGLWGVLKAGAAYVPIDVEYPRERVAFMLADAGVKAVLSKEPLSDLNVPVVRLDADWEQIAKQSGADPETASDPDSLLYVIYTSGSTGRPKGAGVYQRAFLNLVDWFIEEFDLTDQDRALVISSFSFDLTQKNLYATLLLGGELHLNPPGWFDAVEIAERIERRGVTLINCTPSAFHPVADALMERGWGNSLRRVFLGGEPISLERLGAWNLAEVINTYGPTECTDIAAFYRLSPETPADRPVPVGHPIANARVYVLDRHLQPCPVGVVGELCVGGLGVGLGYLNDAGLTASKFVPNEFGEPGARLYRTGDVARWLPDGELEFLGRADQQVKVRGFRIEPGEIEAALRQHPAVEEAAILLRQGQLVAYVVPDRERARPVATLARLGDLEGVQRYELPNGMTIFHHNQAETEFLYHELFEEESYLRHGVKMWDGACVFNVGANIGLFDLYLTQRWRDLRILAFEPLPPISRVLRLNLDLYGAPVEVFEHGLASAPGRAVFDFYPHVSILSGRFADLEEERETVRKYLLAQLPEGGEIDEAVLEELIEERLERQSYECSMRTLSEVIAETGVERIDLLKVDVEKAELDVLSGLSESDWPKVYQVVAEVHDVDGRLEQITSLLRRHGFEVAVEQEEELRENEIFNLFAWRPEVANLASPKREPEPVWASRDRLRADLQDALGSRLPDYMVPSAFVLLDTLPLTPNGKLDRRALLSLAVESSERRAARPLSAVEEMVSGLWADVLGIDPPKDPEVSFFSLGGHSLLATQLVSRIRDAFGTELAVRRLFEAPTLAGLARAIEAEGSGSAIPELVRRAETGPAPLSFAQERLWFLDQLQPGTPAFNVPAGVRLLGWLEEPVLAAGLAEIVRRHEALRTTFVIAEGGQPVQLVAPPAPVALPRVDLSRLPEETRAAEARRLAVEEASRPFDLVAGPLMRATLLRLADVEHVLLLNLHHIVSDGWSMGVLVQELTALYGAFGEGLPSPLPELPVQYPDFAAWQRQWLAGDALEAQLDYWRVRLADPPELELPSRAPRAELSVRRGELASSFLPAGLTDRLRDLARGRNATLFMVLLAGFESVLYRYTGQADLVLGTPVAGRRRREVEGLIGFFLNTLALRTDLSGNPSFSSLLGRVRETALEAFAHQDIPFEKLVAELQPERSLARTPFFQVLFNLVDFQGLDLAAADPGGPGGLRLELLPAADNRTTKFDLTVYLRPVAEGIALDWVYDRDLLEAAQVEALAQHFRTLLEGAAADPETHLSALPLVPAGWLPPPPSDRRARLAEVHFEPFPRAAIEQPIHARFEEQARLHADRPAILSARHSWTYRELDARADEVAGAILALRGPAKETEERVALLFPHDAPMVAAMLGALKAGRCYVPLDPTYPPDRLATMLEDSGSEVVLTCGELRGMAERLAGDPGRVIDLDQVDRTASGGPRPAVDPRRPAYILYTSGSVGRPKGVVQSHRNVLHHIRCYTNALHLRPEDRLSLFSSYGFDASVMDIYGALLNGAALLPKDIRSEGLDRLGAWVELERITIYHSTPTVYRFFLDSLGGESFDALRLVVLGGEEVQRRDLERLPGNALFVNGMGPTESTLALQCFFDRDDRPRRPSVPVGWPVEDTEVLLLNAAGEQMAMYGVGEIAIRSAHVALGYWNRPDLTREAFLPDPEGGERRTYRTGDLGRRLPDGSLEFVGRKDRQVKIRGFRVELGEIEARLLEQHGVREAAVMLGSDERLVAYVVAHGEAGDLRRGLGESLPSYMVPAAFVFLDALPLTPTGKIDRRSLPEPAETRAEIPGETAAPRTPTEEILAGIWAEVLDLDQLSIRLNTREDFFSLGGHSLLATRVVSRVRRDLGVSLPVRALFESPTVAGLAVRIDAARGPMTAMPPLERRVYDKDIPLSFAQQRLWFLQRLDTASAAYHIAGGVRLSGLLDIADIAGLGWSLDEIARRHEVLRTTFVAGPDGPVQVVGEPDGFPLPVLDLSGLPAARRDAESRRLATLTSRLPFDLEHGPVARASLLRLKPDEHLLVLSLHHVVADGWSLGVLVRELGALYDAFQEGRLIALAELPVQYADFALWQREWMDDQALSGDLDYWRERLRDRPAALELPTDRPRSAMRSSRGGRYPLTLPASLEADLRRLGRSAGTTLFMTLVAVFKTLLHRLTSQEDILLGTPVAGRRQVETEGLIGCFVNTLVLRSGVSPSAPFRELLERVREGTLEAYDHQDLPFERLVESLHPERNLAQTPLFQALFVLQNAPMPPLRLRGLTLEPVEVDPGESKFDLGLAMMEGEDGGLLAVFEYAADLFDAATMARWAGCFRLLLESAVERPGESIGELPLLDPAALHQVLREWNPAPWSLGEDICLHHLFEAQVEATPGATALVADGSRLSYMDLNARANQLAHRLLRLGVGPEVQVGICMERSVEMVVALLGVLKAGGCYVPLDPSYPAERLAFMLEDSRVPVLLTQERLAADLPRVESQVLVLRNEEQETSPGDEEDPASGAQPDSPAYAIYTSGSTGRPKAAVNTHRAICNRLLWMQEAYRLTADDRVLQKTPFSFDVSVWEFFWPLITGATLVMARPDGHRDPAYLVSVLQEERITTLHFVPSMLQAFLQAEGIERCDSLRRVICSGEALSLDLQERFFDRLGCGLYNLYGPTEAAVDVTHWTCEPETARRTVPIGRPIDNLQIYIADRDLRPVPPGVPGELLIGGVGLARGYLHRPALTAERYIPSPWEPGGRVYRTGDLARHLPSGEIEYLGRLDFQVKLRGFRIELAEIEAVLTEHPGVLGSAVIVREDRPGDRRLIAYIVPAGEAPSTPELQAFLRRRLPEHMIPSAVCSLEAFPLSSSGKLDRRALPVPPGDRPDVESGFVAPRDPVEQAVAGIWAEVLGLERVGVHDSFFALGGHSLLATQVLSRVRAHFGVEPPLRTVYEEPTVERMARAVSETPVAPPRPARPRLQAVRRGERSVEALLAELDAKDKSS